MIVQTTRISRKGGIRYLARHLLDKTDENERIEILAGDRNALHDAQALAGTKGCCYSIRHLSVSPGMEMTPAQLSAFFRAIDAEFGIGEHRPRLIVRHVKKGRSHFHIAVAEVDPMTLRVLDCRRDYARLEELARRYEADHNETVQPSRTERRTRKVEGFSDIARKRAERLSPGFDRTRLKTAFAAGPNAFRSELKTQGLHIADGDKGPILVTASGAFVAAACRTVSVRRADFRKFIEEENAHDRLIGSQTRHADHHIKHGTLRSEAPAAPFPRGNAGRRTGQDRSASRTAQPVARRPAPTGGGAEGARRPDRAPAPAIVRRRHRERLFLLRLGKLDLDDLLRRARDLAAWIVAAFEPPTIRLTRQIAEARKNPASRPDIATRPDAQTYDYTRRMTP